MNDESCADGVGMKCWCCGEKCRHIDELDESSRKQIETEVERLGFVCYIPGIILDVVEDDCRAALVCFKCYVKIDPDMWIDRAMWEQENPVVRYDLLPKLNHEDHDKCWKPETYMGVL